MLTLYRIIALMLGRMKLSMEEAESAYCTLLQHLFQGSTVTKEIRGLLARHDAEADTSYNLIQKIRSLVKEKAEFKTDLIKTYLRDRPDVRDGLLQDHGLDTSLSPCKV
jgi:hypothetical protein